MLNPNLAVFSYKDKCFTVLIPDLATPSELLLSRISMRSIQRSDCDCSACSNLAWGQLDAT